MNIAKISKLQNKVGELSSSLLTFKWWIPYPKLKASKQNSEPFHSPLIPYCFQMSASFKNETMDIFLHRYRGVNEQFYWKINMNLSGFSYEIYIIGQDGNKISQESHESMFDGEDEFFVIDADMNESRGIGWKNFVTPVAPRWFVNNHVHVFCRIKPS